jgi:hypothetical protein
VTIPLTQAISAPVLGRMEARGFGTAAQALAAAAIRVAHNVPGAAFYIWIIVGLDAYVGSYDNIFGWMPFLPDGATGALLGTALSLVGWTIGASIVQAMVYRRGLQRWGTAAATAPAVVEDVDDPLPPRRPRPAGARFDPRAIVLAAILAFAVLLSGTAWPLLAAVAVWLPSRGRSRAATRRSCGRPAAHRGPRLGHARLRLVGGMGLEVTAQRTLRVTLLVLVATWLRYAAGRRACARSSGAACITSAACRAP